MASALSFVLWVLDESSLKILYYRQCSTKNTISSTYLFCNRGSVKCANLRKWCFLYKKLQKVSFNCRSPSQVGKKRELTKCIFWSHEGSQERFFFLFHLWTEKEDEHRSKILKSLASRLNIFLKRFKAALGRVANWSEGFPEDLGLMLGLETVSFLAKMLWSAQSKGMQRWI